MSRRIRTLQSLGGFNNRGFIVLEDSRVGPRKRICLCSLSKYVLEEQAGKLECRAGGEGTQHLRVETQARALWSRRLFSRLCARAWKTRPAPSAGGPDGDGKLVQADARLRQGRPGGPVCAVHTGNCLHPARETHE